VRRSRPRRQLAAVLPHDWKAGEDGYTEEEWKMVPRDQEDHGRRQHPGLAHDRPCAVRIGHSESDQPGVRAADQPRPKPAKRCAAPPALSSWMISQSEVPLALQCEGRDEVFRRPHPQRPDRAPRPQPLGGRRQSSQRAATNAVQIAEVLVSAAGCRGNGGNLPAAGLERGTRLMGQPA